jgi:hypothetical protein
MIHQKQCNEYGHLYQATFIETLLTVERTVSVVSIYKTINKNHPQNFMNQKCIVHIQVLTSLTNLGSDWLNELSYI